jgi:hypothetical protein
MPRHDPTPASAERRANAWRRYRNLMSWMATAAVVAILLSLIYLKSSGEPLPVPALVATIVGVGFSVLLGTGLMGLVFLSNSSGYDDDAARGDESDD